MGGNLVEENQTAGVHFSLRLYTYFDPLAVILTRKCYFDGEYKFG